MSEMLDIIGRFGIIGNPLGHSLSPLLFRGIFKILGLDFVYIPFQLRERELSPFLQSMKIKGFDGMNVTIPFKEKIIELLDSLDEHAEKIKAVNTIIFKNGQLMGFNTDFYGFFQSIQEFQGRIKRVLILGGGGAARAVLHSISFMDYEKITLIVRNHMRRGKLYEDFSYIEKFEIKEWKGRLIFEELEDADFVINATPIGLDGSQFFSFTKLSYSLEGKIFYDLLYHPPLTPFLSFARAFGAEIKNGLEMLFLQAMKSFQIWTGIKTKKEDWQRVYDSLNQSVFFHGSSE